MEVQVRDAAGRVRGTLNTLLLYYLRINLLVVSGSKGLSILLGNGDGTFQAPVNYQYAAYAYWMAAADFNGDGKLDLAVDSGGRESYIFLGNGDGTFQQPIDYLTTPNSNSPTLTVGDFNGDGTPDWATADPNDGATDVMLSAAFKAVAPASLNFGSQGTGTTSNPQTINISNPSNVKINFASIISSGSFSQTNDCGASLSLGASCQVSVTFSPTTTGSQSGNITITDSTRISPLAIALTGTGVNGPFLTSYPSQQNFLPQTVGVSSSPAAIVIENTGNASLNVTGISITGTNSSDFTQANNCAGALAPAGTCSVNVKFTPTAGGSRIANLSVSDTAPGSPQAVALTGTGLASPDFTISLAPGSSSPKTVNAGQSATFTLSLGPSGSFSGVVNLTCGITPAVTPPPTCTLSNSSMQISGGTVQSITVTVGTTAPASSGAISKRDLRPGSPLLAWFTMILATACLLLRYRTRLSRVGPLGIVLALATMAGCGGGGSSTHTVAGTPSGTYTAAITAISGNITHTVPLQVVVQ
jgi:FG-GAP-like repeat/Abnormal spindle-like microcephaly-assoc'd, ASPM-SPD-2-Hydin